MSSNSRGPSQVVGATKRPLSVAALTGRALRPPRTMSSGSNSPEEAGFRARGLAATQTEAETEPSKLRDTTAATSTAS